MKRRITIFFFCILMVIPFFFATAAAYEDVGEDDFFFEAVEWAKENGITNGVSETSFLPDKACTNAEFITFLWRASGSPKPADYGESVDLRGAHYAREAVLWAMEEGCLYGADKRHFSSNALCTRGYAVKLLWEIAGSPETEQAPFYDVLVSKKLATAVSWAVSEGITNGNGDMAFSSSTASRGEVITFLYRLFSSPLDNTELMRSLTESYAAPAETVEWNEEYGILMIPVEEMSYEMLVTQFAELHEILSEIYGRYEPGPTELEEREEEVYDELYHKYWFPDE